MNNLGHVSGYVLLNTNVAPFRAMLWSNGRLNDISLGGKLMWATAINDSDEVVVTPYNYSGPSNDSDDEIYKNGVVRALPNPMGAAYMALFGLNDVGAIFGESTPSGGPGTDFVYRTEPTRR